MAFDIERCRDHNCPTYNDIQRYYGYDEVTSYEELLSRNTANDQDFEISRCYIDDLKLAFGEDTGVNVIDSVDPLLAMLLEPATVGQMGITMFSMIREQFVRSMVGDSCVLMLALLIGIDFCVDVSGVLNLL